MERQFPSSFWPQFFITCKTGNLSWFECSSSPETPRIVPLMHHLLRIICSAIHGSFREFYRLLINKEWTSFISENRWSTVPSQHLTAGEWKPFKCEILLEWNDECGLCSSLEGSRRLLVMDVPRWVRQNTRIFDSALSHGFLLASYRRDH